MCHFVWNSHKLQLRQLKAKFTQAWSEGSPQLNPPTKPASKAKAASTEPAKSKVYDPTKSYAKHPQQQLQLKVTMKSFRLEKQHWKH